MDQMRTDAEGYFEYLRNYQKMINSDINSAEERLQILGQRKSSIVVKKIKEEYYYYEQWRENGKVNSKYLGKVVPGIVSGKEQEIDERNRLLADVKEKKEMLALIERSIKEYRKKMKQKILQDYSFEVFWKDTLCTRVKVTGSQVHAQRLVKGSAKQIFANEKMTRNQLNEILRLRCFEEGRGDIQEKLKYLGLESYNPYEIVKRTHGVSYNDYIWFRFPGENITSKDVLVRE